MDSEVEVYSIGSSSGDDDDDDESEVRVSRTNEPVMEEEEPEMIAATNKLQRGTCLEDAISLSDSLEEERDSHSVSLGQPLKDELNDHRPITCTEEDDDEVQVVVPETTDWISRSAEKEEEEKEQVIGETTEKISTGRRNLPSVVEVVMPKSRRGVGETTERSRFGEEQDSVNDDEQPTTLTTVGGGNKFQIDDEVELAKSVASYFGVISEIQWNVKDGGGYEYRVTWPSHPGYEEMWYPESDLAPKSKKRRRTKKLLLASLPGEGGDGE